MRKIGRKPKLSPERAAELRRRYALWFWNRPKRLMQEFGVTASTLTKYAYDRTWKKR